ncbi:MAG: hypothetical protein AAF732_23170 [Pseudomonadota bacterium]
MNMVLKSTLLAGMLAFGTAGMGSPAHAQIAASLPMVDTVAQGEATDADGTYVVSTINKRITIENGRAYVIDPWNTALIFTVKAGMVTLQNFRQTGPNSFEADDLPMMGKVVFNRQPNGTLQGVVKGAMGEAKYALVPTEYASVGDGSGGGDVGVGGGGVRAIAQNRVYQLWVSESQCVDSDFFRKTYGGVFNISMKDANGNRVTSKNRNFKVKCTKKGPRKQNYKFYSSGPGALTVTIPPGEKAVSGMRVGGKNTSGKNVTFDRSHSTLIERTINQANLLEVGQTLRDTTLLTGKAGDARLYITLALKRTQ